MKTLAKNKEAPGARTPEASDVINFEVNHMNNDNTFVSDIIPFCYESNEIRTLLINDQSWFVAADVSTALQYRIASDMTRNLDNDERGTQIVRTLGGDQQMLVINESGLYSAILRSRKAEAKRFKKWVTAEVLPAIRKHGRYEEPIGRMGTLIGQTIGTDGFHMLGSIIKGKVASLPPSEQRRAKMKIWAQTHVAFGVRSAEDIPSDQLDAARNFIAAYTLEGEWLSKREPEGVICLNEKQALALKSLTQNASWVVHHWHEGIGAALKAAQSNMFGNVRTRVVNVECRLRELAPVSAQIVSILGASRPADFFGLTPEECDDPHERLMRALNASYD